MSGEPWHGPGGMTKGFSLVASNRFVWVGTAMEDEDLAVFWFFRREDQIEREYRTAMSLEAFHPMIRPIAHPGSNAVSQVRLRRAKSGERPIFFPMELIPDELALIELKAKN
jgi:hypothetical protein